jgi:hypothetical protein
MDDVSRHPECNGTAYPVKMRYEEHEYLAH